MFTPILNHYQQAIARLMSQYSGATNLQDFISAIVGPVQDIEGVLNDLNVERMLANAFGQQLDNIGKIVGLSRPPGVDDDTYRNELLAEIKINVSEGQPEQAIQTFQLFTMAALVLLDEYFPAEVLMESDHVFTTQSEVDNIIRIMQEVLPAGVRCNGVVEFDPSNPFAMQGALSGGGFGDSGDPTQGALLATIKRGDGQFAFGGGDSAGFGFGSTDDPLVGGEWVAAIAPPYYLSSQVPTTGDEVEVQFSVAGLPPLVPNTGVTGFTVMVNSSPATISTASVAYNSKIILAISSPLIHNGDTVTVAYTPGNLTDTAGNALAVFTAQSVNNNSTA